jgi:hypothetical protein
MAPTTPPLVFNYNKGEEIETKHKEVIRQLYSFAKVLVKLFIIQYKLRRSIIKKILRYDALKRSRISRFRRPSLLTNTQVDEIIEYLSEL